MKGVKKSAVTMITQEEGREWHRNFLSSTITEEEQAAAAAYGKRGRGMSFV